MEAIRRIEVEDFPAFIVVDDKGNDFFKELRLGLSSRRRWSGAFNRYCVP
jgi:tartrate dehydratase beta subunit/fumarate hydratase class I family protein